MKTKLLLLKENVFIKGGVIFASANFIVGILNYLFHSISAKALGPTNYSEVAALFSYIALFTIPLSIIGNLIIQRLGYAGLNREVVAKGLNAWLAQKKNVLFGVFSLLLLSAFIIPSLTNISLASALTLVILIILTFYITFYNALAQGLSLFYLYAIGSIAITIIKFSGSLFAYFSYFTLPAIYISLVLGFATQLAIMRIFTIRHIKQSKVKIAYEFNKKLGDVLNQRYVYISILSLVTFTLLSNADIMYVKRFFEAKDAGVYSAWSLFAKVITYVTGPLFSVIFIFFARQEHLHKKSYMTFSLILITIASMCAFFLYKSFAKELILLMFSKEYLSMESLLGKAAIFGYLYAIITGMNFYFVARRKSASLIIPATIVFYLFGLWIFGRTLVAVMNINIIYSLAVTILFGIVYFQEKQSSSAS